MLENFRAKVIAIEESKDLDDIKIQELTGLLQTHELSLPSQRKSKSLTLKKNGKFSKKGKFPSFGKEKKDFKRKDGKDSQSS